MRRLAFVLVLAVVPVSSAAHAGQLFKPPLKIPNEKVVSAAQESCQKLFEHLKAGRTQKIADWIISEVGFAYSEADKITKRNDFKSKLDLILAGPPASSYGKLDDYVLLDEAYLPGSDRFFRFVYLTYHQFGPLLWEFRFYVRPDGAVKLNFVTWSDKNPFEFLATSDMRLPSWIYD